MCLWMDLFGFHLRWDLLCFLDLYDCFSHQVREVFCHYFSKQVFYPLLLLFSLSGIPVMWILLCFMLSWSSPKSSSFFLSLFLYFIAPPGNVFLPFPPICWFDPQLHQAWFLFLLLCSSFQILYSLFPPHYFFFFLIYLLLFNYSCMPFPPSLHSYW